MLNVLNDGQWTSNTYLPVAQANSLAIHQELIDQMKGEKAEYFRSLFARAVAECRAGVAWNVEQYVAVGQKPLLT